MPSKLYKYIKNTLGRILYDIIISLTLLVPLSVFTTIVLGINLLTPLSFNLSLFVTLLITSTLLLAYFIFNKPKQVHTDPEKYQRINTKKGVIIQIWLGTLTPLILYTILFFTVGNFIANNSIETVKITLFLASIITLYFLFATSEPGP